MVKDIQFLTDTEGHKTAFVIPIDQYKAFQDWLDDMDVAEAARRTLDEPTRPFADVVAEMQAAYELDV